MTKYVAKFESGSVSRNTKKEYGAAYRVYASAPAFTLLVKLSNGGYTPVEEVARDGEIVSEGFSRDSMMARKAADAAAARWRKGADEIGVPVEVSVEVVKTEAA